MNQVLHIFRKDTRRLWIEVLISVAALGVLTWTQWRMVTPERGYDYDRWYREVLPFVITLLSWWFITVRLVHNEALVGDRQFWITRPYVWYKLLAAKILFAVLWIGLPILISQIVLLALHR